MALLLEVSNSIRFLIADRSGTHVDMYALAADVQKLFPAYATAELIQRIAEEAIRDGAQFVVWAAPV